MKKFVQIATLITLLLQPYISVSQNLNPFEFAKENKIDSVKLFLDTGGDVNLKNKNGLQMIHFAAVNNHYELAKLLIKNSADLNHEAFNGTPLRLSAQMNNFECCELFIKNGADLEYKDKKGRTALNSARKNPTKKLLENPIKFHEIINYQEVTEIMKGYNKFKTDTNLIFYAKLAIKVSKNEFGIESQKHSNALGYLPTIYNKNKQKQEAIEAIKVYREHRMKFFTKGNLPYVNATKSLAVLYSETNKIEEAKKMFIDADDTATEYKLTKNTSYISLKYTKALFFYQIKDYKNSVSDFTFLKENLKDKTQKPYPSYYQKSLEYLAQIYEKQNNFNEAEKLHLASISKIKKIKPAGHINYIWANILLADMYVNAGNFDSAIKYYQKSIDLLKKYHNHKNKYFVYANTNLGNVYKDKGDYTKAETLAKKSMNVAENLFGKTSTEYIVALRLLSTVKRNTGFYEEAISLNKEGIRLARNYKGNKSDIYAAELGALGNTYISLEDYKSALSCYEESGLIYKAQANEKYENFIASQMNLATVHNHLGNYQESEKLFNQVIKFRKEKYGEFHPKYANTIGVTANLYINMGNFKKAESYIKQAMAIKELKFGKNHVDYAVSVNNLAVVYMLMKEDVKAEKMFLEAIAIYENLFGNKHREYANSLQNLGQFYNTKKDYKLAEKHFKEASKVFAEAVGKENSSYGNVLASLGMLYVKEGKAKKGIKLLKESIQIIENSLGKEHPSHILQLSNLAQSYRFSNESAKAENTFLDLNPLMYKQIDYTAKFLSEKERELFIAAKADAFFDAFSSFSLDRKTENPAITEICFNNSMKYKGLLLNSTLAMRQAILSSKDTALTNLYFKYTQTGKQLSRLYSQPKSERKFSIDSIETVINQYEKELSKKTEFNNQSFSAKEYNFKNVQKALKDDEVAIEFIRFKHTNQETDSVDVIYAALVVNKKDKYPVMKRLFNEKELINVLGRDVNLSEYEYIKSIYESGNPKSDSLYNLVWKPIELDVGETKKIIISPVGLLNRISFDALPQNKDTILSDKYHIFYAGNSSKVINTPIFNKSLIKSAVLFGGLEYDLTADEMLAFAETRGFKKDSTISYSPKIDSLTLATTRGASWGYLPGSLEETQNINHTFTGKKIETKVYESEKGTEEVFKEMSGNAPTILHISTHGFYFPNTDNSDGMRNTQDLFDSELRYAHSKNPLMRSGLVLSGGQNAFDQISPPEGLEDGVLSAYEVSQMNLFGNKLAVLSACQTGLGDIKGNEGVYGLQRAFKMAGTEYLIFSLWEVPDETTRELMSAFYTHLLSGDKIHLAFKKAQNTLKEKYKDAPGSAFAWAAFILMN